MNCSASSNNWISKPGRWALVLTLLTALAVWNPVSAQQDPTITTETERGRIEGEIVTPSAPADNVEYHSPRKATLMSVALPGLGQIYNKKWWKVPIIYGGFAVAGYYLKDNLEQIDYYASAYRAATDDDPLTNNPTDFSPEQLSDIVNQYKQWRDLSYIAIAAIYILNIVDANVDAHLFHFDVSEDISLEVRPYVSPYPTLGPGPRSTGLTLALKL